MSTVEPLVSVVESQRRSDTAAAISMVEDALSEMKTRGAQSVSMVVVWPDRTYRVATSPTTDHLTTVGALMECIFQRLNQ